MENLEFMTAYRKKEVNVILEFPETSNSKEVKNFQNCLKELYLKKVKRLSEQEAEADEC